MGHFLFPEERALLKVTDNKIDNPQFRDRSRIVLLLDQGWSPTEIGSILSLSEASVVEHIQEYQTSHNPAFHKNKSVSQELSFQYEIHTTTIESDIQAHLLLLRRVASMCTSVAEIGLRTMISTWGLLRGLAENNGKGRSYLGVDLVRPDSSTLELTRQLSEKEGISFTFWQINDLYLDLPQVDMLLLDSLHTYCHLTYELEKFSPKVQKYIALHDTSAPWGEWNDSQYKGDYSEYPPSIDRIKRGTWNAVEDFLKQHRDWLLVERHQNDYGLTLLKRIEDCTHTCSAHKK